MQYLQNTIKQSAVKQGIPVLFYLHTLEKFYNITSKKYRIDNGKKLSKMSMQSYGCILCLNFTMLYTENISLFVSIHVI